MKIKNSASTVTKMAAAALSVVLLLQVGAPAMAQDYRSMSCNELWYARNAIYANKGYCFRTARARAVFGPACFPPYGQLSRWEQERVENIKYWESRRGC